MKKIKICFAAAFALMFLAAGCGKKETAEEFAEKWDFNTYQTFWMPGSDQNPLQLGEHGYYFFYKGLLNYYEIGREEMVPVCNKPECSHKDSTCNALLYGNTFGSLLMAEEGIYYTTAVSEENSIFEDLYLIRKDGSGSEFVTRLHENVPSSSGDMNVDWGEECVDQGILYFTIRDRLESGRNHVSLWRVKTMHNAEPELLYEEESADLGNFIGDFSVWDGVLYFRHHIYYSDDHWKTELCSYTEKQGVQTVLEERMTSYCVVGSSIYFTSPDRDGFFQYDMEKKGQVLQINAELEKDTRFYWDGQHFFSYPHGQLMEEWDKGKQSEEVEITVWDLEGKQVDQFSCQNQTNYFRIYGGTEKYLLVEGKNGILVYSKDQIGSGKSEWSEWK